MKNEMQSRAHSREGLKMNWPDEHSSISSIILTIHASELLTRILASSKKNSPGLATHETTARSRGSFCQGFPPFALFYSKLHYKCGLRVFTQKLT